MDSKYDGTVITLRTGNLKVDFKLKSLYLTAVNEFLASVRPCCTTIEFVRHQQTPMGYESDDDNRRQIALLT